MKPKPLVSLNHLTVPCDIRQTSSATRCARTRRKQTLLQLSRPDALRIIHLYDAAHERGCQTGAPPTMAHGTDRWEPMSTLPVEHMAPAREPAGPIAGPER